MSQKLKFHLFQFASCVSSPLETLENLKKILRNFSPNKNEWLVFPEMWPSPYEPKARDQHMVENAFCFHWLKNYAKQTQCFLIGSMLELKNNHAYNTAYLIDKTGSLRAQYRKIHLFRLAKEDKYYQAGNKISSTAFKWGHLGLAICFDLRFPELFTHLVRAKAKVIVVPSAWPLERIDHFQSLLKARAIENQCFMVGVNKIGTDKNGVLLGGHTSVYGPWGEKIAGLKRQKGILSVTLDLSQLHKIRQQFPFLSSRIL